MASKELDEFLKNASADQLAQIQKISQDVKHLHVSADSLGKQALEQATRSSQEQLKGDIQKTREDFQQGGDWQKVADHFASTPEQKKEVIQSGQSLTKTGVQEKAIGDSQPEPMARIGQARPNAEQPKFDMASHQNMNPVDRAQTNSQKAQQQAPTQPQSHTPTQTHTTDKSR